MLRTKEEYPGIHVHSKEGNEENTGCRAELDKKNIQLAVVSSKGREGETYK